MMQFNPLFFNTNQPSPEISKPNKFGSVSYLFSDIIKVFLTDNGDQNPEEQKILSNPEDEINSLIDTFSKTGNNTEAEKPIEELPEKKLKLSLDEISDSSIQKVFAGIANAVLQAGMEVSIKKGSENSNQKIELKSDIPETGMMKAISLFIEQINENFGMQGIDKSWMNKESLKNPDTIQQPVFSELPQSVENDDAVSLLIKNSNIEFKLESPQETLNLKLSKPEQEKQTGFNNKNIKIFNSIPESEKNQFKLETQQEALNPAPSKPEQEKQTSFNNKNIKIFNSIPEPEKNQFKLEINYSKVSPDEPVRSFNNSANETIEADKFFYKGIDDLKLLNSQSLEPEKAEESSANQKTSERIPQINFKKVITSPDNKLKNEIKLKVEIEPKETPKNEIKPQARNVKFSANIIYEPGKESIESAPLNESKKIKDPVFFSLEVSKDKEPIENPEISVLSKRINLNEVIKTVSHEEKIKPVIADKELQDNQNKYSDQLKQEDPSKLIKNKIQDSIPFNSEKEFSSILNNGQTEIKEIIQKGNLPLPSFKAEEARVISYSKLTDEISGIIKQNEVKTVVLKLQPDELGKVKVVLDMVNNGIKANIEVGNEAVRQTVQSNIEQLKQNLIQQGIQLSSLNITLNDFNQKPNKTFEQKKLRNSEHFSEEEIRKIENRESSAKKLGYNTYEYLI